MDAIPQDPNQDIYQRLYERGFSKTEIQYKMEKITRNSPILRDSFCHPNMCKFFSIVNAKFPTFISVSNYHEMLSHRRIDFLDIMKDHCDMRWNPFIFDVFVFPLILRNGEKYFTVELVYLDRQGRRRSCPLDCIPQGSKEMKELQEIILEKLREFGVDSKIADFSIWGKELQKLNVLLKKTSLRQRALAFKGNNENEEINNEYVSLLKKNHEDPVYCIRMEVSQSLSCLDRIEEILRIPITRPSSRDRLEIIFRRFRMLDIKMKNLEYLSAKINERIIQTDKDKKYAAYYSQKNNPVNLLHIVPIHSYEVLVKDLSCYTRNVLELLENPDSEMGRNSFNLTGLGEELLLIDIEDNGIAIPSIGFNELFQKMLIEFKRWRKILYFGANNAEEYLKLCNHFTSYKTQPNLQSRFAEEFCQTAENAPKELPYEQWIKYALLRAWEIFEIDSYN